MSLLIGHETCERLLPSVTSVEKSLAHAGKNPVVFLTPFVTNQGFSLLKETLVLLRPQDEVFVNDWGVLLFCTQKVSAQIFIGRILSKQFLATLLMAKEMMMVEQFKGMLAHKIMGIEVDQVDSQQKVILQQVGFQWRVCQRPKIVAVTRRCVFNRSSKSLDQFADCQKECLKQTVMAENTLLKQDFVFSGNAIYRA